MTPDQRTLDQLSLTLEEYERIVDRLGREPNEVELGMFGALWSEHCGYKNSKPLLKLFPSEGTRVLTKAGEENAGVIDIGDGWGVAFKIESHNHPSAIEPYEGAATGVGGIVRDIFAMGARPVAILDSLRFGPLQPRRPGRLDQREGDRQTAAPPPHAFEAETPEDVAARNRRLFQGVVAGIGGYGNCLGIPTVGGEVYFAPSYSGNPLVNAMCVGLVRLDRLVKARADGPGNLLMLVGADTGRDGIHGATFASVQLDESSEERRPAVQVGNPFMEKLLMEACLELTERHTEWIVGLQDLGAAGLTSSTVECAAKAGTGLIVDVTKVPRREAGMTAYEVMLSESQERMLVIVKPEHEGDVRGLFERWELHCETIGVVTDDGVVRVREGEREVAAVPARLLTDAPAYVREGVKPRWLTELQAYDLSSPAPATGAGADDGSEQQVLANDMLLELLASPNIASKRWVWRQYDHQVGTNTVVGPGSDAAVIRIKGTAKALAIATDGNAAYTYLDPYTGGAIAVAEAARNVACTGARPLGMTNCLNFGNPEKPEVYYQLEQAIRGMADAARALEIPVISGNVSLYNETEGAAIWPTPVVGVVGLLEGPPRPSGFVDDGDAVYLVRAGDADASALAGSEYMRLRYGIVAGRPQVDLDAATRLQRFLARTGALKSAHDVGVGGLAVALAESCIASGHGLEGGAAPLRDLRLFGEQQSAVVVSCAVADTGALESAARADGLRVDTLGVVRGERLRFGGIDLSVAELRDAYENGIPRALEGVTANV
ncbi:MAG TPA: phosphoribosylformylglycinamidine synthase subunit PurL [Dehalococcoidia bacterium]|nr:phosphoribosylformylglycinamidine synthase subunit PurL [Dehalococcoidia bacterium]